MVKKLRIFAIVGIAAVGAGVLAVRDAGGAGEPVLNLYSARHYATDEALYQNFTRQTGIKVNLIEGSDEQIIERTARGREQPADVLLWWMGRLAGRQSEAVSEIDRRCRRGCYVAAPPRGAGSISTRARLNLPQGRRRPEAVLDYADQAARAGAARSACARAAISITSRCWRR
jgi:hypothetical protein